MADDAKVAVTFGRSLSVEEVQKMHAVLSTYIRTLPLEVHEAEQAAEFDMLIKGIRLGLEAAASVADCTVAPAAEIRALDPNTIAKDAK